MTDSTDLMDELRTTVALRMKIGFESPGEIAKAAFDELVSEYPDQNESTLQEIAVALAGESLNQHEESEAAWTEPTDCDRLDWLFAYLESTGVAARQNFWCCQTCATSAMHSEISASDKEYVGFVYFHAQDSERAANGGPLTMTYGADDDEDENIRRVGIRLMKAASIAGLKIIWSGDTNERIKIKMDWKRRRISQNKFAPVHEPDSSYRPLGANDDDSSDLEFTALTPKQEGGLKAAIRFHEQRASSARKLVESEAGLQENKNRLDCPRQGCGGVIIEKQSSGGKRFYVCTKKEENNCPNAYWYPPLLPQGSTEGNLCPQCKEILLFKQLKSGTTIACSAKECDFRQYATGQESHV